MVLIDVLSSRREVQRLFKITCLNAIVNVSSVYRVTSNMYRCLSWSSFSACI